MENDPARNDGKNRFKSQDQRGIRGWRVALRPNLQRVRNPQREYGRINNGADQGDIRKRMNRLDKNSNDKIEQSANRQLPHRERHRVISRRKLSQHDDMKRPEQRADQFQCIAESKYKPAARGKQERTDDRQRDRDDCNPMRFFFPKKKKHHRNQNHIQAGNETGVAGRGVNDACLLQSTSKKQHHSRDEHPFP